MLSKVGCLRTITSSTYTPLLSPVFSWKGSHVSLIVTIGAPSPPVAAFSTLRSPIPLFMLVLSATGGTGVLIVSLVCHTSQHYCDVPFIGLMQSCTVNMEQYCVVLCPVARFRNVPQSMHQRAGRHCIGWRVCMRRLIRTPSFSLENGTRL